MLVKRTVISAAVNATEGTYGLTPGAANSMFKVFGVKYSDDVTILDRNQHNANLSPLAHVAGARYGMVEFNVDLVGGGAAGTAPDWGLFLKGCGFTETIVPATSVTYALASSSLVALDIACNTDGIEHELTGCRGDVTFSGAIDSLPIVSFRFMGKINSDPSDASLPTGMTYQEQIPTPFLGVTLSLNSVTTHRFKSFEITPGNNVVMLEDAQEASGHYSARITDRKPAGKLDIESPDSVATENVRKLLRDATAVPYSLDWGAAGNNIAFASSNAQVSVIGDSERNGISVFDLDLGFVRPEDDSEEAFTVVLT